jgi:glyceraldehyde 3-phosphate dehydrogenase
MHCGAHSVARPRQHNEAIDEVAANETLHERLMTVRVAINGFGRTGRMVLRSIVEHDRREIEVVAINDLGPIETNAHLLHYDSVHGRFPGDVKIEGDSIDVGCGKIKVTAIHTPAELPHKELGVDIALECTGLFTKRDKAAAHLAAGAKRVLVSAPCDGADKTIVYGVNHQTLTVDDLVVSNGSCTTNCLTPVTRVLLDLCGIERGFMTTVHSYTGGQPTLDTLHKDLYRARAAAMWMIPTSTGAAKALGLVLPELVGKLDGSAVRVPTPNVSMIDFKVVPGRVITKEEINEAMTAAATTGPLKGVLAVTSEPLVSVDLNHVAASSTVALPQTHVVDGLLARVLAWYDNEWAFSTRMSDVAVALGNLA